MSGFLKLEMRDQPLFSSLPPFLPKANASLLMPPLLPLLRLASSITALACLSLSLYNCSFNIPPWTTVGKCALMGWGLTKRTSVYGGHSVLEIRLISIHWMLFCSSLMWITFTNKPGIKSWCPHFVHSGHRLLTVVAIKTTVAGQVIWLSV